MIGYKKHDEQNEPQNQSLKRKVSEKQMKMVADAVKKLISDNMVLKKAVRKLVEKDEQNTKIIEQNSEKVRQFDNLAQAYHTLNSENQKLKTTVDHLRYAARDKCDDISFRSQHNNFNNPGGPGVF